ncbi:PdaC/SigV domain-containing protein [Clostridium beijerinckii]|uniref:PdaC/SigV domain-containing protein n=1 Tax=Clostridium beijerinckii TaxID=1520 RepID=UPI0009C91B47|nr:DUF4163 domain-containing protein [Clostridium beijerinckii]MBA8933392.1 hypothetical protein [Clostridium beijerinckii]NRT36663.1 hypothetical protein [Clostridium beijerinckii]NRT43905.1 hypothetical protein [Clostridium beijerinckii]NRU37593.1 hypothetical protein [Clostridium beijerinckii]NRZ22102.1 hypothetical protein [Clostridium beijerinckii]
MKMKKSVLLLTGITILSFLLIRNFYVNNLKCINSIKKEVLVINKTNNSNMEVSVNNKSKQYEIIDEVYSKDHVKINYPQIKNYADSVKLDSINKDLKNAALSIVNIYVENDTNINDINMEVNYEVKTKNNKYISIAFNGLVNIKGTAYPTSIFYTVNIDLENCSVVGLSDYANVQDVLKKLKKLDDVKMLSEDEKLIEAQKSVIKNISDDELLNILKDADFHQKDGVIEIPKKGAYSYMEDNKIVISIPMIHAIGNHAEFIIEKQ